ncbi:MAG: NAD-dependent epimerase/dehydratase family protein [Mycobacteriales bacterium]
MTLEPSLVPAQGHAFLHVTRARPGSRHYVVTGAAGFIGSHLCERLLADGHWVLGVDSFDGYYAEELKRANLAHLQEDPRFQLLTEDLLCLDWDVLLPWAEGIFHLAGQPGVRPSWGTGFDRYTLNNVLVTQRLLDALSRHPVPAVQASSSSVYGQQERERVTEDTPLVPASPYGMSKMACEHLARIYANQYGTRMTSLRYFTVYGPRQRPDMAFTRFISAALAGEPVHLLGTGKQTRDFTYVADVVDATVRAIDAPGPVYNIGGGSPASIRRVVRLLGELLGQPLTSERKPLGDGDVTHTWAHTGLAREQLDWRPHTKLAEGLAAQIAWLRSQPMADALAATGSS